MAGGGSSLEPLVCAVHGNSLVDGTVRPLSAYCVESDLSMEEVKARHFPHVEKFVWGENLPDPYPVKYCPACRDADQAWSSAPGEWLSKAIWMRAGFDPYRGIPLQPPEATLVEDYVWIEKWCRAVEALGLRPFIVDLGACRTIEEYILQEAEAARADRAPKDAIRRIKGIWRTIADVRPEAIRGALGLELQ